MYCFNLLHAIVCKYILAMEWELQTLIVTNYVTKVDLYTCENDRIIYHLK